MNHLSVLAHVNGSELPASLLEQVVLNNRLQNLPENEETRALIKNELIAREVLSQKAVELGLDASDTFKNQMSLFRQLVLAEMLLNEHLAKHPVTEADVRQDYARQAELLKNAIEFRVSSMVVTSQQAAESALSRLDAGEAFSDVARDVSIEPNKEMGGDLGWLLPHQIISQVAAVVVTLSPGEWSAVPIESAHGWHLAKLEATRPYELPTWEMARDRVRNGLLQQQRNLYITQRMAEARIAA